MIKLILNLFKRKPKIKDTSFSELMYQEFQGKTQVSSDFTDKSV